MHRAQPESPACSSGPQRVTARARCHLAPQSSRLAGFCSRSAAPAVKHAAGSTVCLQALSACRADGVNAVEQCYIRAQHGQLQRCLSAVHPPPLPLSQLAFTTRLLYILHDLARHLVLGRIIAWPYSCALSWWLLAECRPIATADVVATLDVDGAACMVRAIGSSWRRWRAAASELLAPAPMPRPEPAGMMCWLPLLPSLKCLSSSPAHSGQQVSYARARWSTN